ncbi:MAG TPA: hypothetical protein VNU71_15925 [Burkholderiaceae bacterium]|nr:hypothetical protein [Burkholderiaceae bacterium]
MLATAAHVSPLPEFLAELASDEPFVAPLPLPLADAPLTPYARSERLFRYELAAIFSAMLIVLVVVGSLLLFGP